MDYSARFFDYIFSLKVQLWQDVLEDIYKVIGLFNKTQIILFSCLMKERCIASYLLARSVIGLGRKSGWLFVAMYLKQCSNCLMIYRGENHPQTNMTVSVSTTKSGLPRIIPSFHRRLIRDKKGTIEGDLLIQWYLSLFSLSKVIRLAKRIDKTTLRSIIEYPSGESVVPTNRLEDEFEKTLPSLIDRYLPSYRDVVLDQVVMLRPTWKSLPTSAYSKRRIAAYIQSLKQSSDKAMIHRLQICSSSFTSLIDETKAWLSLEKAKELQWKRFSFTAGLWVPQVYIPGDHVGNTLKFYKSYKQGVDGVFNLRNQFSGGIKVTTVGTLGQCVEGGGKRRIFAIGNYINQRLLRPTHDWAMAILRLLPTDGTFRQDKPIDRIRGNSFIASYDLSSATDRWPIGLIRATFSAYFGKDLSEAIVLDTLFVNGFQVPFMTSVKNRKLVAFKTGNPLGYYSSWALFALSHHAFIWWAAEQVYPGQRFLKYGILGDDVMIADRKVGELYAQTVEAIGVAISKSKTLKSETGCVEFAKRFLVEKASRDLSPISIKCLLNAYHPFGLYGIGHKYLNRHKFSFSNFCRLAGVKYQSLGRITTRPPVKVQRLLSMWWRLTKMPYKLWLGDGNILNPYVEGRLAMWLLAQVKPKDLTYPPSEQFVHGEDEEVYVERTMLRSWMEDWLSYNRWYYLLILDPVNLLDRLIEGGPIIGRKWQRTLEDLELKRFGMLWKARDKVKEWNKINWSSHILGPNITRELPEGDIKLITSLLEGFSGTEESLRVAFIVIATPGWSDVDFVSHYLHPG